MTAAPLVRFEEKWAEAQEEEREDDGGPQSAAFSLRGTSPFVSRRLHHPNVLLDF